MRRSPALLLLSLLAVLALLAGCGTSGGDDADTTTTAAAGAGADDDPADDPADDPGDDEPTDDPSDEPTEVTQDALEALLPTLDDLDNADYTDAEIERGEAGSDEEDGSDEGDESDQQFEEACPGIEQLEFFDDTESDEDSVAVTFNSEDDREVEVRLDPTTALSEENLDTAIEVLNDCGSVSIDDEDAGTMTIEFQAERDDTYGDHGLRLTMEASFEFFGQSIDISFLGTAFQLDGIGVFVSASSGIDESDGMTMTPVPLDAELVDTLGALMDERVGSL